MIYIDGSANSGSGTIVRSAVALACLLGEDLHISNIRAKREKPGLRPQHLADIMACAQMCNAQVTGATVNSKEVIFKPGERIRGGHYDWDIGTAGSTTLLAMTTLPLALFADRDTSVQISGGLFQDFAPSAHYMQHVLSPTLRKMGIHVNSKVVRPGYVPKGAGILQLGINPLTTRLQPLNLPYQGAIEKIEGLAISSHLKKQRVSHRMAEECKKVLASKGHHSQINTLYDDTAAQAGASLAVWAITDSGCLLGADWAGKQSRSSESIGRYVATNLLDDLSAGATVDRHLADQLIIFAALAQGATRYFVPQITEHVNTNLWLVRKFGAQTQVKDNHLIIEGIAHISHS
ncbi:MAG: RNA 3'-terminal phosphate cyclase [Chloroflexota bacterium]|nr:RNA 3'-terminal phosphate cyclase [Chloroflexota bacterium]